MYQFKIKNDASVAIVAQIFAVTALTLITAASRGWLTGASMLLGGVVCVLPNIFFYRRAFAYSGARAANKIVSSFYWGEAAKMGLTALGFLGAFAIPGVLPLWLFVGYIVAQAGFFFGPAGSACWRMRKNA